mmetsp:Transcript_25316/g.34814  ORF Transcript_25316/g.34814 Transcript_25316/m.34814 type:complete len:82 (-) Transcript_25316:319-564(-)
MEGKGKGSINQPINQYLVVGAEEPIERALEGGGARVEHEVARAWVDCVVLIVGLHQNIVCARFCISCFRGLSSSSGLWHSE